MDALNYQWSSERMEQSRATIFDQLTAQLAELERKICAFANQSVQNTNYYHQQPIHTPNYYHPSWPNQDQFFAPSYHHHDFQYSPPQQQVHKSKLEERLERFLEGTAMKTNNQEVFAPELSYPSEFSHQPQSYEVSYQQLPPQQENKSNFEELITKYIEQNETRMNSQELSMRNLENQMGQLANYLEQIANAINNRPQEILPSDTEINLEEEGKELCEANTLESGKMFQEAVRRNLKRSHPDGEEKYEVEHKRSKIEQKEENDEDDQVVSLNGIEKNSMVSSVQQIQKFEEYYRVDFIKENNLDEYKFGGNYQFFKDAMELKEKTTRRHEKTIFAIEPD